MLNVVRTRGGVAVAYVILVGNAVSATVLILLLANLTWPAVAAAAFSSALLTAGLLFTVREMLRGIY